LLALLAPLTLGAGGEAEVVIAEAPVVVEDGRGNLAEIKAFQATLGRYDARMNEFQAEARSIVDRRESEERGQLDSGYGALIGELNEQDLALRETAMKRFEAFLTKYPRSTHTPHVMFRLAELYFEQSEEDWFRADKELQAAMESLGEGELDDLPEDATKDYRRSIALYKRIIEEYPDYEYLDGCYYMLGYCASEPASEQYDEDAGREHFEKLVERFPESEFAAAAHLRVGEYHFDYNDLDQASLHYRRVVELEGREGSLYDEGLYKLAWSQYKRSNYDEALSLLTELLDWSSQVNMAKTGKESPMAPEAIEYTAISFSDVAEASGQNPITVAQSFYARVGNRDFESKVYKRLADVLKQQARYDDAIAAYQYIQETWPEDPENPTYQWTIAQLHMSKVPPGVEDAQSAIADLTDTYNEESRWHLANRANPDALAVARGYIEQSLAAVAVTNHTKAIESGAPEDFATAAEYYRKYLTKFPFAADYYEIEWYLADTLLKAGKLNEAAAEYEQLLKGGDHNYHQGALWLLMQVRRQSLIDTYGAFDKVPAGAVVERKVQLSDGRARDVYTVKDDFAEFMDICDRLVASDFDVAAAKVEAQLAAATEDKDKERHQTDLDNIRAYAEALEQFRPALAYLPAQVLYYHGRFEEARPRFELIIDRWPRSDEAAYSASLMIDSFQAEGDLANVRKYAGVYSGMRLGQTEEAQAKNMVFSDLQEGATFKLAEEYIEQGKRKEAAEAFLAFIDEFPDSKYRKDALYNAANSYEIIYRVDESIRLFEQYVVENPEDERSRPLYFRLARNYATALELEQAIKYYEDLYQRTEGAGIEYQDAPNALYNAGFLRIGIGDSEGAARNFERYASDNPELADAEETMFQAGEQWERVSGADAIKFYERYLRVYPDADADHVMEAHNRIATLTEESGARQRDVDKEWERLGEAYDRLSPTGEIGSAGRHYAAHVAFRQLKADYESFQVIEFTRNDDKNATLLLETKKAQLEAIAAKGGNLVATYQDFEYSSAAIYVIGMSFLAYADMLYDAPPPKGLDEDELMLYQEAIDEIRIPIEDKGRARLEANLEKARAEKLWSVWITTTLEVLAKRYPAEHTVEKEEIRGMGDSTLVPMGGPISLRGGDEEEAEASESPDAPSEPTAPSPAPDPEPDPASPWASPSDGGSQQ